MKKEKPRNRLAKFSTAIAFCVMPYLATAETYNANIFLSQNHVMVRLGYTEWADNVAAATEGAISFEVFSGGSLLPPAASMQGLRDGVAHVSYHAGTYTPAELPISNVISDLSFKYPDPLVMAFASTEFGMTYQPLLDEWRANGIVFGGGYSTPPYHLMCNTVIQSIADLKGKKMRVPGSSWSRFAEHVGAIAVSIPSTEMYTGLDNGSLDCAVNAGDALDSFSLKDVAKSVVTLPLGLYFSGVQWGYNKKFWSDLTTDHRRVLFDEMANSLVRLQVQYEKEVEASISNARNAGVTVVTPTDDMQATLAAFVEADLPQVKEIAREKRGIADPEPIINEFIVMLDKWAELLKDVDREDEATMIALVKSEIYNKLDPATYGQ